MTKLNWKLGIAASAMLLASAGCNGTQRDAALRSVRSLQQSGTAQAAVLPEAAPQQAGPPPAAPPPGTPPPPAAPGQPPATPPATPPGAPGADKPPIVRPGDPPPAAPAEAAAKTPEQIIADFMTSDPRDILIEKSARLKEKETKPWETSNPDTFIPETGRKDPLTAIRSSIPKELLPTRTGDDDTNELQSYLLAQQATSVLTGVSAYIKCYSVIQIGLEKYARFSFDPAGKEIQTLSLNDGYQDVVWTPEGPVQLSFQVVSISADEVVIDVDVSGLVTNVSVTKEIVFIPRNIG